MLRKSIRLRLNQSSRRISVRRRLLMEQLGDRRVLATLTGIVFDDANESFKQESGESGLASRLVYLDQNDNGSIDLGEPYQLTDDAGKFALNDVAEGLAIVRVFDGSLSQRQTFPVEPETPNPVVSVSGTTQLLADDLGTVALSSGSVESLDFASLSSSGLTGVGDLTKAQRLADGRLLVIGSDDQGNTAWVVDTATSSLTPVELADAPDGASWVDVAIGNGGLGVVLQATDSGTALFSLDASDPQNLVATATGASFAEGATAVSSATGPRSVIASPTDAGLGLTLWSNTTASAISSQPVSVSGLSQLIAFDDATGLLAARTIAGEVSILDVDAQFAQLHLFETLTGPIAIDGERELLVAVSPADSSLLLVNLSDGSSLAQLPVNLAEVGELSAVAFGASKDAIVVAGSAGVTRVALRRPAAHRVLVNATDDPASVSFGFVSLGSNAAPVYSTVPELETLEDIALVAAAPTLKIGSVDADGDDWIVLPVSPTLQGQVAVGFDGSLQYTPNQDFFGTDAFSVQLHDGRSLSPVYEIDVVVVPVPDAPSGVDIKINPVPENIPLGDPIGTIEVIDVDLNNNHTIVVNDERFIVVNGQIILFGGGLDYETEPLVPLTVTVTDPETQTETVAQTSFSVRDENDPITGITPSTASVFENVAGELIVELVVQDEDAEQSHLLTVDDDRFVIDFFDLRLAEGVSLNFEAEPSVVVNVTATEIGTGGTFTQAVVVQVKDVVEQPTELGLTNNTVVEMVPGDDVGDVTIDGAIAPSRFALTVDDPRFEVEGSLLKLLDGQWVETATQSEIQLQITATDTEGQFSAITQTFVITVLEDDQPYHNDELPEDVDRSGTITASDALEIIHYLNVYGPGPVGQGDPGFGYDVNSDGQVTALDALLVINALNRLQVVQNDEVAGEPEQLAEPGGVPGTQLALPSESSQLRDETQHDQAMSQFGVDRLAAGGLADVASLEGRERDLDAVARDWLEPKEAGDDSSSLAAVDQFLRLLDATT